MTKKKLKFEWVPSTVLDALQPYTREVLECLARHAERPGIAGALVSDESAISDFLDGVPTGESRPHPFDKGKTVECYTSNTPENQDLLKEVADELSVPVGVYDYIYEVAIRLRDR